MKTNILLIFLLTISQIVYSQTKKEIQSTDSIIIAITNYHCQKLTNPNDISNAKKMELEFLSGQHNNLDSLPLYYSSLLQKYNFNVTDSVLFKSLLEIKTKVFASGFSYINLFNELDDFSNAFSQKNPQNKILLLEDLKKKYLPSEESIALPEQQTVQVDDDSIIFGLSLQMLIIIFLCFLLIILLYKLYAFKQNFSKKIREIDELQRDLKSTKRLISQDNFSSTNQQDSIKIKNLENKVNQLMELNAKLSSKFEIQNNEINNDDLISNVPLNPPQDNLIIFYSRIPTSEGNFRDDLKTDNFENSLSMVKFTSLDNKKAFFEYCGDSAISKLVINNPDSSIGLVSDYENSRDFFKTTIETKQKGEVELRDGIWFVTKKAKIKFS